MTVLQTTNGRIRASGIFTTPLLLIDWLSGHCETTIFFIQILLPVASQKNLANIYCQLRHTFKFLDASGVRGTPGRL